MEELRDATANIFLSTPSARRATLALAALPQPSTYFYPRPPRGGRPSGALSGGMAALISIHALREEGDLCGCRRSL